MVNYIDLTLKYQPKDKSEFIGNENILEEVTNNISEDTHVLVVGESGWGKTSMAHVVAHELGLTIVENNPCDERSSESIKSLLEKSKTKSLLGKNLYLFESVDTIRTTDKNGSMNILSHLMKKSVHPIFLTAHNEYLVPYEIKKFCKVYKMKPPSFIPIVELIKKIASEEGIPKNKINFKRVTHDIRSSIIACFSNSDKMRETANKFQLTESAFFNQKIVDLDPVWLMDNVHNFYHGIDVYNALKVIKYAIETGDNYFYSCLPNSRGGRASYPYMLRKK